MGPRTTLSATARDRDRLRQTHLQRLGWRFHRYLVDGLVDNREQETQRAVSAYEEAVRLADLLDAHVALAPTAGRIESLPQEPSQTAESQRGPQPLLPVRETIDQYTDEELRQIAKWLTSDGLLRTDEELIRWHL